MNCNIEGCPRIVAYPATGLCAHHYKAAWARARRPPPGPKPTMADRFWAKVVREGEQREGLSRCWAWSGATTEWGYGVLNRGRGLGTVKAHRLSYEMHRGPIPSGMFVLHSCDNPPCCNPDHLSIGTNESNMRQMGDRGRSLFHRRTFFGETHGMSKLTEAAVVDIRASRARGVTLAVLAERYGVSKTCISDAARGRVWAHVGGSET